MNFKKQKITENNKNIKHSTQKYIKNFIYFPSLQPLPTLEPSNDFTFSPYIRKHNLLKKNVQKRCQNSTKLKLLLLE